MKRIIARFHLHEDIEEAGPERKRLDSVWSNVERYLLDR